MSGPAAIQVVALDDAPPPGWDDVAVAGPGGQVLQGITWAEHIRARGGRPRFARFSDGGLALVLEGRSRLAGREAYCRRGPIAGEVGPVTVAARATALAARLGAEGVVSLTVDPELPASPAYEAAMDRAGFRHASEAQPSIHLLRLELPPGTTEAGLLAGCSKSTRQRIRAASAAGVRVRVDPSGAALDEFATFLVATAERRGFDLRPEAGYLAWWRRLLASGQALLFAADLDGRLLGATLVYLQGGTFATAFSGDRLSDRRTIPGVMHLLRWTIICEALAGGARAVALGGVDTPGHRAIPTGPGDAGWGLYQHKAGFGARWVWQTPARRILLRPRARLAAGLRAGRDAVRRWGPGLD